MHFIGVHLIGLHFIAVHLMGVHLVDMHLIGMHLMGVRFIAVHLYEGVSHAIPFCQDSFLTLEDEVLTPVTHLSDRKPQSYAVIVMRVLAMGPKMVTWRIGSGICLVEC